jgi:hypothetical protein
MQEENSFGELVEKKAHLGTTPVNPTDLMTWLRTCNSYSTSPIFLNLGVFSCIYGNL